MNKQLTKKALERLTSDSSTKAIVGIMNKEGWVLDSAEAVFQEEGQHSPDDDSVFRDLRVVLLEELPTLVARDKGAVKKAIEELAAPLAVRLESVAQAKAWVARERLGLKYELAGEVLGVAAQTVHTNYSLAKEKIGRR